MTDRKEASERNKVLNQVIHDMGIIDHAYNSKHFHSDKNGPKQEKVMDSEHNAYMEGIIGAVYFDSGFYRVKEWILYWLVPRLEEAKKNLSKEEKD